MTTIDLLEDDLHNGTIASLSSVHKFGRAIVGTTLTPVCFGGVYRTPQVSGATALRVKAGDAADTAAGAGAREIMVQGLDASGNLQSVPLPTAGISAGAASTETFIRVFRAWVSSSGTYATQSAGSHEADIVIENAAGTEDWLTIDSASFPKGQSEIGAYSVPLGKKAYMASIFVNVDATKITEVLAFKRGGILKTAAPYDAMRADLSLGSLDAGSRILNPDTLMGPYPELTDLGFMGKVTVGTAEIDVDFEIILVGGVS